MNERRAVEKRRLKTDDNENINRIGENFQKHKRDKTNRGFQILNNDGELSFVQ